LLGGSGSEDQKHHQTRRKTKEKQLPQTKPEKKQKILLLLFRTSGFISVDLRKSAAKYFLFFSVPPW
jgi:uncharacterized membrane protein